MGFNLTYLAPPEPRGRSTLMDPSGRGAKTEMSKVDRNRFSGFADLYASVRPRPPTKVTEIALGILGQSQVGQVVDLGSGTGLSTSIWQRATESLIGIEPTKDMRNQAEADFPDIRFQDGSSYATGLSQDSTDIVCCSQSFHWMEPQATLLEVNRILKPTGVFLVYDCLWPVTWDWRSERQYKDLLRKAKTIAAYNPELAESSQQYPKDQHLANLERSGYFAHVGSVYFDNAEVCDANRFVGIALSQGLLQSILKKDPSLLSEEMEELERVADSAKSRMMRVSYVLHYGVKFASGI